MLGSIFEACSAGVPIAENATEAGDRSADRTTPPPPAPEAKAGAAPKPSGYARLWRRDSHSRDIGPSAEYLCAVYATQLRRAG
jgi:hypothetical protein